MAQNIIVASVILVKIFLRSATVEYDGEKTDLKSSQIIRNVSVQCIDDDDEMVRRYPHFMKATVKLKRMIASYIDFWTKKPIEMVKSKKLKLDNETVIENLRDVVKSPEKTISSKRKRNDETGTTLPTTKKAKLNENKDFKDTEDCDKTTKNGAEEVKTICIIPFSIDEVIWGKIRGWPHWPCRILEIDTRRQRFKVYWFNDYRTTNLFRSQIFKFYPNFDIFAEKLSTTIGLKDATKEAMLYIVEKKKDERRKFFKIQIIIIMRERRFK